jgi:hypothetical protein
LPRARDKEHLLILLPLFKDHSCEVTLHFRSLGHSQKKS